MRIDYEEIKKILSIFIESHKAHITIKDLNFVDINDEQREKLVFHLSIMVENGLISNSQMQTGNLQFIGIESIRHDGKIIFSDPLIRLTNTGHEFAKALNEKPIFERIKKEMSDAPFEFVKEISKKLLTKILKENLDLA